MRAVNLIPADQRGRTLGPARSQGAAYLVLVALGGVAVMTVLYGVARHQVSTRRSQVASLSARVHQSEAQAAQLAPYTSFIALREQRTQAVSALVNSRFDWAHALHEIGRVLPSAVSINLLNGTIGSSSATPGASSASSSASASASSSSASSSGGSSSTSKTSGSGAVTSATPPGSVPTITLSGCATSQTEVARMLDRLRLIDGVTEATLEKSTKTVGSSSGGGSGGCANGQAAFMVQVYFAPLPVASAFTGAALRHSSDATVSTGAVR